MSIQASREKAAQVWCKPSCAKKIMDVELCEAFAETLEEIWSQPWLGNATTEELLNEIKVRIEMDGKLKYRTVEQN